MLRLYFGDRELRLKLWRWIRALWHMWHTLWNKVIFLAHQPLTFLESPTVICRVGHLSLTSSWAVQETDQVMSHVVHRFCLHFPVCPLETNVVYKADPFVTTAVFLPFTARNDFLVNETAELFLSCFFPVETSLIF